MYIEDTLQAITTVYPFRDSPIRQLFHYLNLRESNRILAYGPSATCKTSVVGALAERFDLFHVTVNVLHHISTRNIYESILKQIKAQLCRRFEEEVQESVEEIDTACINSLAFIEKFNRLLAFFLTPESTSSQAYKCKLIIILDNADSLFTNENNEFIYLMNYLDVHQISSHYLTSIVYIARHTEDWINRHCESKNDFLQVAFNAYSNTELNRLLNLRAIAHSEYSAEFYANYVNFITKSFTQFTRNFIELQSICLSNFQKYVQPIEDDEISERDSAQLYLRFQPKMQEIIRGLFDHKVVRIQTRPQFSPSMNYLLVAAYLASYNSTKEDKRHFVRNQGRHVRKRRKTIVKKADAEVESKAPKLFTFERLYHIYLALINLNEIGIATRSRLTVSSVVYQQFNELIKQNLILGLRPSAQCAPISSASKYQISDSITTRIIDDIAFSISLNLKAFMEGSS